jgi:hypothetical protein
MLWTICQIVRVPPSARLVEWLNQKYWAAGVCIMQLLSGTAVSLSSALKLAMMHCAARLMGPGS